MARPDPIDPIALCERLAPLDLAGRVATIRASVPGRLVFTTSLGLEDQALAHAILSQDLDIELVTLDTGRLFSETHDVWAATEVRYGRRISAMAPAGNEIEALIAAHGPNGFRKSVEARKACCHVRKVVPLARALAGADGWITGLRADQSDNRGTVSLAAHDLAHGILKLNPLADWARERVADYVAAKNVPVNALHAQGFPSIGCAPCTRAVLPGEPERAGRWWWESDEKKECGLHPDHPVLRRARDAEAAHTTATV